MKNPKTLFIQVVFFVIYYLIVYNIALPNVWLSAILALLLVYTFTNSNNIKKLNDLFSGGLVDTFKVNDYMHDQNKLAIEDLNNKIIDLEYKLGQLENKIFDLENPRSFPKD